MKKKEAAAKQKKKEDGDGENEDEDLVNPNHVQKKLNISDLNEPRQLSRRERYCTFSILFSTTLINAHRVQRTEGEGRCQRAVLEGAYPLILCRTHDTDPLQTLSSCTSQERPTKPNPICLDLLRSVLNVKPLRPRGRPKSKVCYNPILFHPFYPVFPSFGFQNLRNLILFSIAKQQEAEAKKQAQLAKRAT